MKYINKFKKKVLKKINFYNPFLLLFYVLPERHKNQSLSIAYNAFIAGILELICLVGIIPIVKFIQEKNYGVTITLIFLFLAALLITILVLIRFFLLKRQIFKAFKLGVSLTKEILIANKFDCWQNGSYPKDIVSLIGIKSEEFTKTIVIGTIFLYFNTALALILSCAILYLNPIISLIAIFVVLNYYLFNLTRSKKIVNRLSVKNAFLTSRIKELSNAWERFRLQILINNDEENFLNEILNYTKELRINQAQSYMFAVGPKYALEYILLLSIILVTSISIVINGDLATQGTFQLANVLFLFASISKLVPTFQGVYATYIAIKSSKGISLEIRDELQKRNIKYISVFKDQKYREIIDQLLYTILNYKYQKKAIQVMGVSGCGKSSLFRECLNKLYENEPKENEIFSKVAYLTDDLQDVKQQTLINQPFMSNVKNDSDIERWKNLCLEFNLSNSLESISSFLDRPFESFSRGQKQRLLIIAEILKLKRIFLLDEATSGLDKANEKLVLKYLIKNVDVVLFISHSFNYTENIEVVELLK